MAVSDIIILVKSKRPPAGYSFIGEINNHTICVKFSPIPTSAQKPSMPVHSLSSNQLVSGNASVNNGIPPRPASFNQNMDAIEQSFVHVLKPDSNTPTTPDYYNTTQRSHNLTTQMYNPLQGVPFELNPVYDLKRPSNRKTLVYILDLFQNNSFLT